MCNTLTMAIMSETANKVAEYQAFQPGLITGKYYQNLSTQQQTTFVLSISYIVVLFICTFFVTDSPLEGALTITYNVLAGVLGWVVGMAISPYNQAEFLRFASIGKTLSAFVTGYTFSKINNILDAIGSNIETAVKGERDIYFTNPSASFQICSTISMFLIVLIVTYVFRYYDKVQNELANKQIEFQVAATAASVAAGAMASGSKTAEEQPVDIKTGEETKSGKEPGQEGDA